MFPRIGPEWLQAILHAVIAPIAAVATFIGSMGNGPLAALLWENGVASAGIMAFLAADFVVPPSLKINANYYGWRFSLYLAVIFTAAAVISGVVLHGVFAVVGLIPDRDVRLAEQANFELNHTFFLNMVAFVVAAVLLGLRRWSAKQASPGHVGGMNADDRPGSAVRPLVPWPEKGVREGPVIRARRSTVPLVLTWLGVAVGLGLLLVLARAAEGPLDDPDPAWQRPGFLDPGELPVPAPDVLAGFPPPGRPAVVFFVRTGELGELCHSLAASELRQKAAPAVVVAGPGSPSCEAAGAVVSDPEGTVAEAYGIRRPRGGGPPVGYAVVDASGDIRYRTLDPEVADQVGEVRTIVAALP